MTGLFSIDEALGHDALIARDEVPGVDPPTVYVAISCAHPGCTARERAQVDATRPTPDTMPLWRQMGWVETLAGAFCPDHRNPANRRQA